MENEMGSATMPITLDQHDVSCADSSPVNFSTRLTLDNKPPDRENVDFSSPVTLNDKNGKKSILLLASMQDYSDICKGLDTSQDQLLDCRVPNREGSKIDNYNEKIIFITQKNSKQEHQYFVKVNERLTQDQFLKINEDPKLCKKRPRKRKDIECYKCQFCPLMTLKREMMLLHEERKGACASDVTAMLNCPGCTNIFFSNVSMRVHLAHDHNMVPKDVKAVLQHLTRVKIRQSSVEEKSSCVYNTGKKQLNGEGNFDLSLSEDNCLEQGRPSCANVKRPSLLETYLDDISSKNACALPPRLSESGDDLLENTFNFTAPVSEQLPSIQPEKPPAASKLDQDHLMEQSDDLMDDSQQDQLMSQTDAQMSEHLMANEQPRHVIHSREQELLENGGGVDVQQPLTEGEVLQQAHIIHTSNAFLTMNNVFQSEETYTEEPLEEYVYIEEGVPVVNLEGKHRGSYEFTPCEGKVQPSQENADEKTAIKKISCGFRCDINGCKFRMQSEENIKYHRRCHEGQLYNCPECCKDCRNWVSLSSHLWQKHKIDMELYQCDLCSYRTPSYSRLTSIHRGIHGTVRPFLCDVCGKGFKTVKQMRNHKMIHKAKMVRTSFCPECSFCGRSFSNNRVLEQHIKNLHKKLKPFLCSVCGYTTAVKHSLIVHIRKHTGEKPHKCDKCEYETADHNALRRHKLKHSGGTNYKCPHCTYTCIQASSFKIHIKQKHPGLEQDMIFSCERCRFETLKRGQYLAHMAQHNDTIQFYTNLVHDQQTDISVVDLSNAQSLLEDEYYGDISGSNLQQSIDPASANLRHKS